MFKLFFLPIIFFLSGAGFSYSWKVNQPDSFQDDFVVKDQVEISSPFLKLRDLISCPNTNECHVSDSLVYISSGFERDVLTRDDLDFSGVPKNLKDSLWLSLAGKKINIIPKLSQLECHGTLEEKIKRAFETNYPETSNLRYVFTGCDFAQEIDYFENFSEAKINVDLNFKPFKQDRILLKKHLLIAGKIVFSWSNRPSFRVPINVNLSFKKQQKIYLAKKNLLKDSSVEKGDFQSSWGNFKRSRKIINIDQFLNYQLKRKINQGKELSRRDLYIAPLVKHGEKVSVVVSKGSLKVKTSGIARQSGVKGDTVYVYHPATKRKVQGVITAKSLVEVVF